MKKTLLIVCLFCLTQVNSQTIVIANNPAEPFCGGPYTLTLIGNDGGTPPRNIYQGNVMGTVFQIRWRGGICCGWEQYQDGTLVAITNNHSYPNPPNSTYASWINIGSGCAFNTVSGTGTQGSLLPVSLTYFTAQKTTNGTVLNWKTASESNNKGFEVEKSIDGTNFTKIGFVTGSNTSQDVQHYQYTDNTVCTGRQLYRLKQIDNDNNFKYSSIATVSCGSAKNITISPNPAASSITIVADSWAAAKLVNTNGQTVSTIRPAVSNTQQADISKLPNGLYVLQVVYKDGSMVTEKIQVIH